MGMIGEAMARSNAERLEKVLYLMIKEEHWNKDESAQDLYNWYLAECEEAFMTPDRTLVKEFAEK